MAKDLRPFLRAAFLAVLVSARLDAQTAAPAVPAAATAGTNAPAATPPAGIPLASVVTQATADTATLEDIQSGLSADQATAPLNAALPGVTQEIDQRQDETSKVLDGAPSLSSLRTLAHQWQTLQDQLADPSRPLTDRVKQLDDQVAKLTAMTATWKQTLTLAQASSAPPDIISRINTVIAAVASTTKAVEASRAQLLSTQNQVAEQQSRITAALSKVKKAQDDAVNRLFMQDSPPIWSTDLRTTPAQNLVSQGHDSFLSQMQALHTYAREKIPTFSIHLIFFLLLAAGLFWVRNEMRSRAQEEPALQHAAPVFEIPLATGALFALIASLWLYPLAPRLFWAGVGAAALIPAIIILRRLIDPSLYLILYALVVAYFLDQVRYVTASAEILSRFLLLFEILACSVFVLWLLWRMRRLSAEIQRDALERAIKMFARGALVLFLAALLANVLGYVRLGLLLGNATLESAYLAVILYAAVRIFDAMVLSALRLRPLSQLGMVQRHYPLLCRNVSRYFRWAAFLFWLWSTLEVFSVRSLLVERGTAILNAKISIGSLELSLGDPLAFGLILWISYLISKFLRFVLEEEVYPHLQLGRGVPYAASTMVHYAVLVLGGFAALAAAGIDLSKYTVLAGALGVGLGFGLQNIMNNFVSGIILLFERPIKVGDVIQVDTNVGVVQSIGIRASVIRITNGSEIIVPNGNLISNQVTNWTFSNRQRVVELTIGVAPKTDPQRVIEIMVETAKAQPLVLKDPPPKALCSNFGAAALTFELRAWTGSYDEWTQVRSDLSVAINAAFTRENIALA